MESETAQGRPETDSLVKSLSIEIILSQIALTVVVFPLVMLVIPTLLFIVGLTSFAGVSSVFVNLTNLVEQTSFRWVIGFAIFCIGCVVYTRNLLRNKADSQWRKRSRPLPSSWGMAIETKVSEIWSDMERKSAPPKVYWFPALDIAAYAVSKNGPQIYISAALAQALLRNEARASAIIAHEIGHLTRRDLIHFDHIQSMVAAACFSQWIVVAVGLLATIGHMIKDVYQHLNGQAGLADILVQQMVILFVGFNWFFLFAVLGWLAVSRHAALLTALIEIRADIVAANWTGGLERFTQAFVSARSEAKSNRHEWINALLSPHMTHLPREERLSLMRNAASIVAPKLKYYLASIALASLLPLNFFVPLMFGGSVSHLASLTMALLVQFLVVIMLVLAPEPALHNISLKKLLLITIIAIVSLGLTRLNLEPIANLFVSWFVGFGGDPMNWSELLPNLSLTIRDLIKKFQDALLNTGSLIAVLITFVTLLRFTRKVSVNGSLRLSRWHYCIVICVLVAFSLLASYDQWRVDYWPNWMISFHERIYENMGNWKSVLLCLPICLSIAVHELLHRMSTGSTGGNQLTKPSSGRANSSRR